MRKRMTAVLAVSALAPLALAAPAVAAPGNGAQRYSFGECFEEPGEPPFEACFTVQGRVNLTQTPSGNFIVNDKGTFTSTFTSGDFTSTSKGAFKVNVVFKRDRAQVIHDRQSFSSTSSDGVTCSGNFRFMIVKDEVKKDIADISCDGLPEP